MTLADFFAGMELENSVYASPIFENPEPDVFAQNYILFEYVPDIILSLPLV